MRLEEEDTSQHDEKVVEAVLMVGVCDVEGDYECLGR